MPYEQNPTGSSEREVTRLAPGDEMPHFRVTTVAGQPFRYSDVWQRKNLVLIVLPGDDPEAGRRLPDWTGAAARTSGDDTVWVITPDEVSGVGRPGLVVADKWGEVQFAQSAPTAAGLARGDELAEWLEFVRYQCPECQGEAK